MPVTTFFGSTFSSLLPYRLGGEIALVLARAPARGEPASEALAELERATRPVSFALASAVRGCAAERFATLTLDASMSPEEASRLRFNPYNTAPDALPVWLPNRLRDPAYRGSQDGRPIPD